jgi:hypothetical protein
MKVSEAFPSKYIKHADLGGQMQTKKISYAEVERVGMQGEERPVLHFANEQRGFVLNKTNARLIAQAYGDDSDGWRGHTVTLMPTRVEYRGEMIDSVRVKILQVNGGAVLNDDVPFAPEWRG